MIAQNPVIRPDEAFTIDTLEALAVLADPLRTRIIDLLCGEPRTVKSVAAELEMDPKKLYYHFRLLEQHELIRVASTQIVSGIIEKHYTARARYYLIDEGLLAFGKGTGARNVDLGLSYVFDRAKEAVRQGMTSGMIDSERTAPIQRRLVARRQSLFLSPEQAQQLHDRLDAITREYESISQPRGGQPQWYDVVLALYPVQINPSQKP